MDNEKNGFLKRTGQALGFIAPTEITKRDVNGMSAGVMPPARSDFSSISPDVALNVGAVYRAVSIITTSVSQMPMAVYRDNTLIKTPALVRQPNVNDTVTGFVEETVWSLATHGNAYWKVYRDGSGNVANLEVLDPTSITTLRENGRVKYWAGTEELPANRIKHLKLMRKPGAVLGYGPIQHGQSEILAAIRMRNFADNWFGISGIPQGILTTDQVLNGEEAQAFAEAWNTFVKNNGTAVMSQGMRYEHLNLKPAEAQMLEVQQAQTIAIARLFGIPAFLLGSGLEGQSTTYTNSQELWLQFTQTTLVKYMNEIEEALASLLPRGQEVRFDESKLLRMDTAGAVDVQVKQIAAGLRTANELRKAEGLPPLPVENKPNSNESSEQNGTD